MITGDHCCAVHFDLVSRRLFLFLSGFWIPMFQRLFAWFGCFISEIPLFDVFHLLYVFFLMSSLFYIPCII